MVALSNDKVSQVRDGRQHVGPVAANTRIFQGALVCRNAAGDIVPGSVSTTLKAVGLATARADNTGGAAAAINVAFERGVFVFVNDVADPITKADVENSAYITDDQTVCRTSAASTKSIAGKIVDIDSSGVWIRIGL